MVLTASIWNENKDKSSNQANAKVPFLRTILKTFKSFENWNIGPSMVKRSFKKNIDSNRLFAASDRLFKGP